MSNILKYNDKSDNSQNNLFLFLENLKLRINNEKLSPEEIYENKLIIFSLLKNHNFNSLYLYNRNIAMYLILYFNFFKYFFNKEDIQNIINKCNKNHQDNYGWNVFIFILMYNVEKKLGFTRDDIFLILEKIDLNRKNIHGWSTIMFILAYNKNKKLGFTKYDIIQLLEKIDLNRQNKDGWNVVMFILKYNKGQKLGFNRDDIIPLLEKIDLNYQDLNDWNILMHILLLNKLQDLGFFKDDVLNLLDRFNLLQKTHNSESVYDFITDELLNNVGLFTQQEISLLISKLDIEMKDQDYNNILIKELKNGLCFDSEELVEKILNTENRDIIDCVYQHIDQIAWKQDKLFLFLKKNEFKINNFGVL